MFVRVKYIGKNKIPYYYLVESCKVDGKIRQRHIKYLGKIKPSPEELAKIIAEVKKDE